MDYKESLAWLYAQLPMFSRIGAAAYKPGLERSESLALHFGNPQRRWKSVHVAGTNGKGSVSNLIAATLQKAGYRTGLYTSPHLVDFRERMRVNGIMIPEEKVVRFVESWQRGGYAGEKPSFFELTMMMAFSWFAEEEVDIAVIETGMGGRLDSTNIITPELSVITNISKDHTQFLGDTLEAIATEKAGIIKPGVPVVIGEATTETERVFRQKAAECGSPIREAYRETDETQNEALRCSLRGSYQKKNVNTARVAVDELIRIGFSIPYHAIVDGFSNVEETTGFTGRWTVIKEKPLTICDTGHNEDGLSYNLRQLSDLMDNRKDATLRFVLGFVADKDVDHILPMFPEDARYYVTNADIPRAMTSAELLDRCLANGLSAEAYGSVREAAEAAARDSGPEDIVYIGGSTFIVADFLASN